MEGKYGVTRVLKDYEQSVLTLLKQAHRMNCSFLHLTVNTDSDRIQNMNFSSSDGVGEGRWFLRNTGNTAHLHPPPASQEHDRY